MSDTVVFAPGGYRYMPAVFQYSGGVAAEAGFELERARFKNPLPLGEAFAAVEAHLAAVGRPTTAFAHCELRSPGRYRPGLHRFQQALRDDARALGHLQGRREPGGAHECLPDLRETGGAVDVRLHLHRPRAEPRRATFMLSGGGDAAKARSRTGTV